MSHLTLCQTVISTGPDWLTCTAKERGRKNALSEVWDRCEDMNKAAGAVSHAAARFGFKGLQCSGAFYGVNQDRSCLILSGPHSAPLTRDAITAAESISRFDLQVTTWCNGETPHVGLEVYRAVRAARASSGRTGAVTIIQSHPNGESCYLNKRSSDSYGRIYDKAAESALGAPRSVWRYEVEFKKARAQAIARQWCESKKAVAFSSSVVHSWMVSRGVPKACLPSIATISCDLTIREPDRDVLTWFEVSVRPSIRKAIKRFGRPKVLEALGLQLAVEPEVTENHAK